MSTVEAPVRHGKCNLRLLINECSYSLRVHRRNPLETVYLLTALEGPRVGARYLAGRSYCINNCTCYDQQNRRPAGGCKHLRSLVALGLLSGRSRRSKALAGMGVAQ